MSEFFSNYAFYILIALLFLGCHLMHFGGHAHGGHGGREEDEDARRKGHGGGGVGGHEH